MALRSLRKFQVEGTVLLLTYLLYHLLYLCTLVFFVINFDEEMCQKENLKTPYKKASDFLIALPTAIQ